MKIKIIKGKADIFKLNNPILEKSQLGYETDKIRFKLGDGITAYNDLQYMSNSTYQTWLDQGNSGTEAEFLASLQGIDGRSAYDVWISLNNHGTEEDMINSFKGENGKSAYQTWLDLGYDGSEAYFINWLKGKKGESAYQTWLNLGNGGSEQNFINSLKGDSAYQSWINDGHEGTVSDFLNDIHIEVDFITRSIDSEITDSKDKAPSSLLFKTKVEELEDKYATKDELKVLSDIVIEANGLLETI